MPSLAPAPVSKSADDFEQFRLLAYRIAKVDLTSYKVPQMQRRLSSLLVKAGARDFAAYAKLLEGDPRRQQEFRDFVTINVTEFFRDTGPFNTLEKTILPELLATNRSPRFWSAGASNGAEAYSLAILLKELGCGPLTSILGTDIDDTILTRARAAAGYLPGDVRTVTKARLERWFTRDANGLSLQPALRSMVRFQKHDLIRDRYPTGPFDMILCRNTVIYFTDEAKAQIYQGFADVLKPGGILFVGGTEIVMHSQKFGLETIRPGFYRKVAA